jgi:hypothetical protein
MNGQQTWVGDTLRSGINVPGGYEVLDKMESVGTPQPYKSDHVTAGGSKSWVLENFLLIFLLYEGPGTAFWAMKCHRFLGRLSKT